jgi:hypothetical protein
VVRAVSDLPVTQVNQNLWGGSTATVASWAIDGNPSSTATFPPDSHYDFDQENNWTAYIDKIIGMRVEIDIVSGTGALYWGVTFDADPATGENGYFALGDFTTGIAVSGPQNFVRKLTHADVYYEWATHPYTVPRMVERVANDATYHHGYGTIETAWDNPSSIVVSRFELFFYTLDPSPSGWAIGVKEMIIG